MSIKINWIPRHKSLSVPGTASSLRPRATHSEVGEGKKSA